MMRTILYWGCALFGFVNGVPRVAGPYSEVRLIGLAMIALSFLTLAIWWWGLPGSGIYRRHKPPAAPTFEDDPANRVATPTTTNLVANVRRHRTAKRRPD